MPVAARHVYDGYRTGGITGNIGRVWNILHTPFEDICGY